MDDDEICTPRKLDPSKEVKEPHNGSQTRNNQMKIQRKKRKNNTKPNKQQKSTRARLPALVARGSVVKQGG
jgi:hypothetical protein